MSLYDIKQFRCFPIQKLLILTLLIVSATIVIKFAFNSCTVKDFQDCVDSARSISCRKKLYKVLNLQSKEQGEQHCYKIIKGDSRALKLTQNKSAAAKNTKVHFNESMYLNLTKDCSFFKRFRKYVTFPMSHEEDDFPIAYSMTIHEKIEMFERLLRAIYAPQNIYCVHVDAKSPSHFRLAVQAIASCFDNVFVASKMVKVVYASWSRVQADFNCMEDLLKSNVQWRYLLNTCGTDFPLKTNAEIVRVLKTLNGKNTLESERPSPSKQMRWKYHYEVSDGISKTSTEKTGPPINSPMFTGNAYFVVSRDFVQYIFKEPHIQKFLDWAKDTYSPDEHLWATLNRIPDVPGSSPYSDKYDLSDMNAMARMVKWSYSEGDIAKGAAYPVCTGIHRRAVCVYGAGDLKWLLEQHHLLANKFDPEEDDIAIQCLEEYLRYKTVYRNYL